MLRCVLVFVVSVYQKQCNTFWYHAQQTAVGLIGTFNHSGCCKNGQYGDGNEYRVQKITGQAVACADIGNDKSKFAQLRQRKAAAHTCFKLFAGKHYAKRCKNACNDGRVNHHAD